jgi:hypothetical protein
MHPEIGGVCVTTLTSRPNNTSQQSKGTPLVLRQKIKLTEGVSRARAAFHVKLMLETTGFFVEFELHQEIASEPRKRV